MTEDVIIVGKCKENDWRRANLMRCKNIVEEEDCYIISFTQVTSDKGGTSSVKVTYKVLK